MHERSTVVCHRLWNVTKTNYLPVLVCTVAIAAVADGLLDGNC
jgi:hypothetical protein